MTPAIQKVAIVTGAAGGQGVELSSYLVSQNWLVACCDLQRGPGEALAAKLGPNAAFFEMNVADYDSQARAFETIFQKWGRIDALLANAGIADKSSIYILNHRGSDTIPPAPNTLCTDVDYKGIIYGTQLAIHFMRKNPVPGGKIVATSSAAALYPLPTYPEYNGAKAAIIQFVRTVAPELKLKENIFINSICPGIVPTTLIPKAMLDSYPADCLTPISTIVAAYADFLSDENTTTGQAVECSVDKRIVVPQTPFLNGYPSQRSCQAWEPGFAYLHHEASNLDDAVA